MSDDEIIAVVQAHKEGKKIQFAFKHNSYSWYDVVGNHPNWNFEQLKYRVAPEPREPREFVLWIEKGTGRIHLENSHAFVDRECVLVREVIKDNKSTVQRMMEYASGFKND